jgi:hypothetical protein
MKTFQDYLQIINESNKDNTASNITVNNVKKDNIEKLPEDKKVLFKSSYGYLVKSTTVPGEWKWPKQEKVIWINADSPNFESAYWFPILDDEQRKQYGVLQFWKYEKPIKTGGRNAGNLSGKKISWLFKLGKEGIKKLINNKEGVQQLNYKTKSVTDSVQTFYGSSQDLLELLS